MLFRTSALFVFLWNCASALSNHQHYGFRQVAHRRSYITHNVNKIKYMIDIDGTICSKTNSEYTSCVPRTDKISLFNHLYEQGHEVRYWGKNWDDFTVNQLESWDVKYHTINMGKDDKAINANDFM